MVMMAEAVALDVDFTVVEAFQILELRKGLTQAGKEVIEIDGDFLVAPVKPGSF